MLALERYPHLLLLHLDANYPTYRWDIGRVMALADGRESGWVRKSMLVTAWQSAGPALDVSTSTLFAMAKSSKVANQCACRRSTLKRKMRS